MSISNWFAADTFLHGGRSKANRPIENNTRVVRLDNDDIAVRLHETNVVVFHRDGSFTLDSGGWLTVTTKDRMNRYINAPIRIASDRGVWYIYDRQWGKQARYFDGIHISRDGVVLNPPDPKLEERKREAEVKMRKRVDTFVDGYMKALAKGMPVPSGGDCWGCSMFERAGSHDNDHLLSHLTERYYVPTLIWNAMTDKGYVNVQAVMAMSLDTDAYNEGTMRVRRAWGSAEPDKHQLAEFRRVLGKYLRKRLIPTVAV